MRRGVENWRLREATVAQQLVGSLMPPRSGPACPAMGEHREPRVCNSGWHGLLFNLNVLAITGYHLENEPFD